MGGIPPYWGMVTVVLAAVLGYLFSQASERRKTKSEQQRMLSIVFGELRNISRHYAGAARRMPLSIDAFDRLELKMMKYGSLNMLTGNLQHIGFLTNQQIADILSLSLAIRNNDTQVDAFLEKQQATPRPRIWKRDFNICRGEWRKPRATHQVYWRLLPRRIPV
jgi:hypothetical protein